MSTKKHTLRYCSNNVMDEPGFRLATRGRGVCPFPHPRRFKPARYERAARPHGSLKTYAGDPHSGSRIRLGRKGGSQSQGKLSASESFSAIVGRRLSVWESACRLSTPPGVSNKTIDGRVRDVPGHFLITRQRHGTGRQSIFCGLPMLIPRATPLNCAGSGLKALRRFAGRVYFL